MDAKQVVIITGASTGFGRLFAETLARRGHTAYATMRDVAGKNLKNAAEIRAVAQKESLPLYVEELDVTDEASIDRAIKAVIEKSGRIDAVINNAGYATVGLQETFTTEQVQKQFDTNFFGPVRVNRAVLPQMRKQRSGLLLHISSGAGRVVFPSFGPYCASKYAMEALAEAYRYELAGQGIDSVLIEPGAYNTAVFGNIVTGTDTARAETYGLARELPKSVGEGLAKVAGDAQEVADVVLQVLETPAGERHLRYRVSPGESATKNGVDEINEVSERVQRELFQAFGLAADVAFRKGKAAGQ